MENFRNTKSREKFKKPRSLLPSLRKHYKCVPFLPLPRYSLPTFWHSLIRCTFTTYVCFPKQCIFLFPSFIKVDSDNIHSSATCFLLNNTVYFRFVHTATLAAAHLFQMTNSTPLHEYTKYIPVFVF